VPDPTLQQALQDSTEEVLEKMFFIRPLDGRGETVAETEVIAQLTFEGDPSGSLTLSVAAGAARSVAADFLGEDEPALSEQQIGDVVCELANMICGSVLSRVESTATFQLASPRIVSSANEIEAPAGQSVGPARTPFPVAGRERSTIHAIETCRGAMVVTINTETSASCPAEKYAF
jgi:CheY-specific phosphatase CheX